MNQLDPNRLSQTLRGVVDDVEHILQTMSDATGEQLDGLKSRTSRQLGDARYRLGQIERQTARQLRRASRQTTGYVKGHPWQTLGGVAAVAIAVALLSRRRH